MRKEIGPAIVALTLLVVGWSCSKEKEEPSPENVVQTARTQTAEETMGYQSVPVQNGGTISGKVLFKGKWTPVSIPVAKDQEICGTNKPNRSLIFDELGGVRDAVVHLTDIRRGKPPRRVNPILDQKACEYEPHVLAFPAGTSVEILNSDGILHNVHSFSEKNAPFNRAQPKFLKKFTHTFTKAELISVRCDVHGWMSAWLFVADNPYYDVTSEKGTFELADVPPGDYTIEVWHEKLGRQTKKVRVEPNGKVKISFEFSVVGG